MRIGFLAMSGIRAHDPELLRLGLTLPGFVERSKTVASLPSLGLLYLAAATPASRRHELRYFEAESDGSEPAEVYACDLVAISTFSAQVFEAYAIADRLRAAGVKVAMGGLHVSVCPDEAARHADYVIIGEGDNVWPAVVRAAEENAPSRRFDSKDFPPVDVAQLPVPRYDLLDARPYNRFTVQTSRGCPWRCDFCASNVMLGRRYRKRPVEHVVRDIEAVKRLRKNPFVEFADDNTFVDKAWGRELCRRLASLRVKWFTETDITVADDEDLLDLMRVAGCRQVLIGLESPTQGAAALNGVEMRADAKAVPRHASLRPAADRRPHPATRPVGPVHAVRRQPSAARHVGRRAAPRHALADASAVQRRRYAASPPTVFRPRAAPATGGRVTGPSARTAARWSLPPRGSLWPRSAPPTTCGSSDPRPVRRPVTAEAIFIPSPAEG